MYAADLLWPEPELTSDSVLAYDYLEDMSEIYANCLRTQLGGPFQWQAGQRGQYDQIRNWTKQLMASTHVEAAFQNKNTRPVETWLARLRV